MAGIPDYVIGLAILSMIFIAFGPAVDILNDVHNSMMNDPQIPMSNERANDWTFLMIIHDNILLIILIGFIIMLVMVALASHTGPTY